MHTILKIVNEVKSSREEEDFTPDEGLDESIYDLRKQVMDKAGPDRLLQRSIFQKMLQEAGMPAVEARRTSRQWYPLPYKSKSRTPRGRLVSRKIIEREVLYSWNNNDSKCTHSWSGVSKTQGGINHHFLGWSAHQATYGERPYSEGEFIIAERTTTHRRVVEWGKLLHEEGDRECTIHLDINRGPHLRGRRHGMTGLMLREVSFCNGTFGFLP